LIYQLLFILKKVSVGLGLIVSDNVLEFQKAGALVVKTDIFFHAFKRAKSTAKTLHFRRWFSFAQGWYQVLITLPLHAFV
jgi:hypothetical protein